jgi:hypothetical protein
MAKRNSKRILKLNITTMKKLTIPFIACLLFTLNLQAQLSVDKEKHSLQGSFLQVDVQRPAFSLVVLNSITFLESTSIQRYQKEKNTKSLPTLTQPKIKLLEATRPFAIHTEEYLLWQKINRRIEPIDIPVWKAISVTKNL